MMKKIAYFAGGIAVAASMATIAGSFTAPNTFTGGETISAAEMNANFDAVKTAVDDNDSRITALENGSGCPTDMVAVGPICVDKYEASVWDAKTDGNQVPCDASNPCDNTTTTTLYARSVAGTIPASNITWIQAQQACANVGKRLLTNAEWQMAAAGTQVQDDQGTELCNRNAGNGIQNTGSHASCISDSGVHDMVGNVDEWVADWVVTSTKVVTDQVDQDDNVLVVRRGGRYIDTGATIFTYYASRRLDGVEPNGSGDIANTGFRCAK